MTEFKIPIFLKENQGLNRNKEPVRIGIPLAMGMLSELCNIRLLDVSDQAIPVQCRPLSFWPDKTIKWLLVDFFAAVKANQNTVFSICIANGEQGEIESVETIRIEISERNETFDVCTGPAKFLISRKKFSPFDSIKLDDIELIDGNNSKTILIDRSGVEYSAFIEKSFVEEKGPLRASIVLEGRFLSPKNKFLSLFKARTTFFSGLSFVRLEFQIRNPRAALHPGGLWDLGDPGSIFVKDLSLQLKLNANPADTKVNYDIHEDPVPLPNSNLNSGTERNEPSDAGNMISHFGNPNELRDTKYKLNQQGNFRNLLIYQDSSGGNNWNSPNHIDNRGNLSVKFRGFRVYCSNEGIETIIHEGLRANPFLKLEYHSGWIATAVMDFWKNFPKALRTENGSLHVGLFPQESLNGFELQGGEQKQHVIFLDCGLPNQGSLIPMLQKPLDVNVDPEWVEEANAVPYFVSGENDKNLKYLNYIKKIVDGPNSFFNKREKIDEYGWRNFGDLYADHEAVKYSGPQMLVSHYNNQYDFIYGSFFHFQRTGDSRWRQLMEDAACHNIDIDIYHTQGDKAAFNGGLFWHTDHYKPAATSTHRTYSRQNGGRGYGGGPSCEHNYTSGLLHYYYATGDQEAANAVLELAKWVILMDDGSQTVWALFDEGPTGSASSTVDPLFHKPGRGAGNSVNALIDAHQLNNRRFYLEKAEELIRRCIHPDDDPTALRLNEPEYRWSYLVFLQILGKYIDFKDGLGEKDFMFFYARDSLLRYADWMVEHEVPYKGVLDKVEIPTETWPAHDIRKCHVFHLASKYGLLERRPIYRQKAEFFFDQCLRDLFSFETAYLTRPMVILAVYGSVHAYFQKRDFSNLPFEDHSYDFGRPQDFIPQKDRVKQSTRNKAKIFAQEVKRVTKANWYRWKKTVLH